MEGKQIKKASAAAVGNPFSALRHKSFRNYWFGMAVSTTGTWMQNVAQPWLAYELTDSAFMLSLVSALQFLPVLLFSLIAGVIVDRVSKKKILFITQLASFLITLVLAVLTYTGEVRFWHLLVTSSLLGLVNAFDMPARQAFVIELVGREDLTNGIALNSVQYNLARIIGPAIAGVIMGPWGVASCFLINAVSYGAVLVSLIFVRPFPTDKREPKQNRMLSDIAEGLKFIYQKKALLVPLVFIFVGATFAMNLNVLVPVFSKDMLGQGETGYGLLMSLAGVGALLGALTMASISRLGPKKLFLYIFPLIVGALVLAIGLTRSYALTGVFLLLLSFFYMIFMSSVNTTTQMNAPNEFRGRVMSVYSLLNAGAAPLGNLFAGAFAQNFNAGVGFIACGGAMLVILTPLLILIRHKHFT